jgi:hypothetical protein
MERIDAALAAEAQAELTSSGQRGPKAVDIVTFQTMDGRIVDQFPVSGHVAATHQFVAAYNGTLAEMRNARLSGHDGHSFPRLSPRADRYSAPSWRRPLVTWERAAVPRQDWSPAAERMWDNRVSVYEELAAWVRKRREVNDRPLLSMLARRNRPVGTAASAASAPRFLIIPPGLPHVHRKRRMLHLRGCLPRNTRDP